MHDSKSLLTDLQKMSECVFQLNVSGKKLTTFSIGGDLALLLEPNTLDELGITLSLIKEYALGFKVIGAGSNVLIPDQGMEQPVIRMGRSFRYYRQTSNDTFEVGASMPLMVLSREVSKLGYSGLEFAGGIPATFGGAIRMNAGAHLGEICQILQTITYYDAHAVLHTVPADTLNFAYRQISLPSDSIIVSATIKLTPGDSESIFAEQQKHLTYRKATQPLTLASAGSIFKNPPKAYAGEVIEKAGFKGRALGNALVSDLHANWIVNPSKDALAQEVRALIEMIRAEVIRKEGIILETELQIW